MTATEAQTQPLVFTVTETAKLMRMGLNKTYEAIHSGEIPSVKIGCRYYVPRAALERMLADAGHARGGRGL